MARPTKKNPTGAQISPKQGETTIQKLDEAFAIGSSIVQACSYADISTQTYYNMTKEKPELLDRFSRLREKPILKAKYNIVKDLQAGNIETSKWYLQKRVPEEFGDKTDHRIVGDIEHRHVLATDQLDFLAGRIALGLRSIALVEEAGSSGPTLLEGDYVVDSQQGDAERTGEPD